MSDSDASTPKHPVLQLTQQLGMVKFGLVAQALIGLVFQRFGARELVIRHNGHPDLTFWFCGERWRVEVEVMGLNRVDHIVKSEDLEATKPRTSNEQGCIALLDMNPPYRWYMLRAPRIWLNGERNYALFELRNNSDNSLSENCTAIFHELAAMHECAILKKGYSGLIAILKKGG